MGEEKVNSVNEKENLGKVILEIGGLTFIAFVLCVYGIGGIFQGSLLGAFSLTLGIFFVGFSCIATTKGGVSKYIKDITSRNPVSFILSWVLFFEFLFILTAVVWLAGQY